MHVRKGAFTSPCRTVCFPFAPASLALQTPRAPRLSPFLDHTRPLPHPPYTVRPGHTDTGPCCHSATFLCSQRTSSFKSRHGLTVLGASLLTVPSSAWKLSEHRYMSPPLRLPQTPFVQTRAEAAESWARTGRARAQA